MTQKNKKVTVFIDGTDARWHIPDDSHGIRVFFSEASLKAHTSCWEECGVVQATLDLSKSKIVVEENHKLAMKNAKSSDQIALDYFKRGPKRIRKELNDMWWGFKGWVRCGFRKLRAKIRK